MVTVDGVPNVRSCVEPLRAGADVRGQNVRGSVDRDLLSAVDRFGGPFTPVGFYYRTMIRPRRLWPVYERFLRSVAGLGRVGGAGHLRRDTEHRRVDVLVVGGGASGRAAAERAAAAGERTLLVDERGGFEPQGYELLAPARAVGAYEGGLVPVDAGDVLYRVRAARLVVATGALEQPLVFPGQRPRRRAAAERRAAARRRMGDQAGRARRDRERGRERPRRRRRPAPGGNRGGAGGRPAHGAAAAHRGDGRRAAACARVTIDSEAIDCDLLVVSGGRQPAYSLLAQAGARIEYDAARGIFVPTDLPANVEVVGAAAGELGAAAIPRPSYDGHGKCVVCLCEDVTTKDLTRAVAEGFDAIELAKRYTTATMGPVPGQALPPGLDPAAAREATGTDEAAIGTTTARPPWAPVELGLLAGRHYEPCKRTPLHARHEQAGAELIWTGQWRRALSYGDPAAEVRAVHSALGVIDVSTLGKLVVEGPDAAAFLERLYPNRFADLAVGRVRYGVLTTDGGRIIDDGTIARLADDLFYVTTTSTGSESVFEWFEWWNAVWGLDVEIANLTGALAAVNLAGPRAREALAALTGADVSNDAFRYLDARELEVAGVPCLALRIGFVGELGYELHCPASAAEHLWDALVAGGAVPFGLEPQRVLRLEKGHVIVGQDTDSESNLLSAGMPWLVKDDKDDFVGKWAVGHVRERGVRERLVGFTMDDGVVPAEGAQVVRDGRPAGRVTSARASERLGRVIGLAWVEPDQAADGMPITIRVAGAPQGATVTLAPFYDPDGERLRS